MLVGVSPFFFSERALAKLQSRKDTPATYNLDMNLVGDYWGWFNKRSYHHTGECPTTHTEKLPTIAMHAFRTAMSSQHR